MARYLTEFIGAFFLVLTAGLTTVHHPDLAPLAVGSVLMVMVYMGAHVSGAHYNPVVTIALVAVGKLDRKYGGTYAACQVAGALVAAAAVRLLSGEFFVVAPAAGVSWWIALLAEALFAFALVIVVLHVAADPRTEGNPYYGLAIGFTVMVAGFAVGGISGGVLNPAVAAGPALVYLAGVRSLGAMASTWLYWVGPVAGAYLALAVYRRQGEERG